jgi:integrase
MPWKLVPPRAGKTPYWYVRGKYCGIRLNHSTGASEADAAARIIVTWRIQAERGEFKLPGKQPDPQRSAPTFATAAIAYMRANGDGSHLEPVLKAWPNKLLSDIDQIAIDALAAELYPNATAATRNRQVYTPVSAILKHVGIEKKVKRPKGWRGKKSTSWLEPDQAFAAFDAADKIDPEFGLLCRHLLYTGMRIEEALTRRLRDLQLDRAYCYLPNSKNGEPRGVHLPPFLVDAFRAQPPRRTVLLPIPKGQFGFQKGQGGNAPDDVGVPWLERRPDAKLFRFHQGGVLRDKLKATWKAVGLTFPWRQGGFHIFSHTYGSWMHRWGNLDTHGLTRTGRWADPDSADRYVHTQQREEARRADLLPAPTRGDGVARGRGIDTLSLPT